MNKFAKYVPEEDKKKQREHIGAAGSIADLCEKVGKVSLMHEQLDFSWHADDGVNSIVEYTSTFGMFEEGKVYDVVLDGTRYEGLVAYYNDDEEYVAIGAEEYDLDEGIIDSKYPFIFRNDDADESLLRFIVPRKEDQNIPYDIEILAEGVVITTIDPKYLPVMTVKITGTADGTVTCDKTYDEIEAHLDAGGIVDATFYRMTSNTPYNAYLQRNAGGFITFYAMSFEYNSDGRSLVNLLFMYANLSSDPVYWYWGENYLALEA